MQNRIFILPAFACLLLFPLTSDGAGDLLSKRISISVSARSVPAVLDLISREGGCSFSYDAGIFPAGQKITYSAENKSVAQILSDLFGERYSITLKGKYVILRRIPPPVTGSKSGTKPEPVSKSIVNPAPGITSPITVISDIPVPAKPDSLGVRDSVIRRLGIKINYLFSLRDTFRGSSAEIMVIKKIPQDSSVIPEREMTSFEAPAIIRKRFAQFSVIPGWGTNGRMSKDCSNALSFNLIAGYSGECRGFEIGMVNIVRENWGVQLAPLVNISRKDNRGAQVAALFNYSKQQNGFQLGLVNIAAETGNGTPVGFFSYTGKDGYYRGEVSADEVFWINAVFRCGLPRFYNIFKTGIGDSYMMNFSWGFGTLFTLAKKLDLCLDFTSALVMSASQNLKYHGMLFRLSPSLDFKIARHFTIFAGPAGNLYWYVTGQTVKPDGIAPYTIYNQVFTTGPHAIQFWVGGVLGIRI